MIDQLFQISYKCIDEMKENKNMIMTDRDKINFNNARSCYLCNEPFNQDNKQLTKVRDHDHSTGCYRGAAHCKCNIIFLIDTYQLFFIISEGMIVI